MNSIEIRRSFEERITQLIKDKGSAKKKVRSLSLFRILIFVIYMIGIVYLANLREFNLSIYLTVLFVMLFSTIVKVHQKAKFVFSQFRYLLQINEEELDRLDGKLHDLPSGAQYTDPNHAYSPDLDLFGSNSLFQLLVRSRLSGTRDIISQWMLTGASENEIIKRQESIDELKSKTDWRQEITALGMTGQDQEGKKIEISQLIHWLKDHIHVVDKALWKILEFGMPILAMVIITGIWLNGWPYQLIFLPILVNFFILKTLFVPLNNLAKGFEGIMQNMGSYSRIISQIEKAHFQSDLLVQHANDLKQDGHSVSKELKKLGNLIHMLQSRENVFYIMLNYIFLLDMFLFRRTLSWQKSHQDKIQIWLNAVHQIDALNDLASFSHANPDFCQPKINVEKFHISALDLGHPLIKPHQRIKNDLDFQNQGQLALITGSNMSGKSTFLRTLGVNLVLAQMGAVICAKEFNLHLTSIFTSMRTQDNLEENVSSFYAELKRIKKLLSSLNEYEPIFYLLDEILKGTNSEDRNIGAVALIDQLTHQNCMGIISTHDIQLADLSKGNPNITNYSFNSTIDGDEINFDYKLTNGACESFNASKLMEKMGIIKKQD